MVPPSAKRNSRLNGGQVPHKAWRRGRGAGRHAVGGGTAGMIQRGLAARVSGASDSKHAANCRAPNRRARTMAANKKRSRWARLMCWGFGLATAGGAWSAAGWAGAQTGPLPTAAEQQLPAKSYMNKTTFYLPV